VVSLPAGAELAYAWSSSDHAPVGYVELPSGPPISTIGYEQAGFVNSSFGYSYLQSDGSPISFSACDSTAPPGTNTDRTVIVTGTYYLPLL